MLTRVEIRNYRGFESYRMEGLSRVNLLVGRNNSGKTALLEGIQFLASGGDPAVLAEAAQRRGEVIGASGGSFVSADIAHFFHGHSLSMDNSFSFSGDDGYTPVTVKTCADKNGRAPSEQARPAHARPTGIKISSASTTFSISPEGAVELQLPRRYDVRGVSPGSSAPQVRFVGPDSLNSIDLAVMWDEVMLTGQERDVAEAMRVLEGDLESLHFLTGMFASGHFSSRGGIVVGVRGQDTRVPLGSMGDGMRRLMALAIALAFTRDGCIFVDEIDTGLHYSVMPDMWKLVITKAAASNTQVFATTHSWDCIEGLSLLCQREPDLMGLVAIHKIDRAIPHSVAFSGESIVRMVKSDIDPR